jgi:hypothetical protein
LRAKGGQLNRLFTYTTIVDTIKEGDMATAVASASSAGPSLVVNPSWTATVVVIGQSLLD